MELANPQKWSQAVEDYLKHIYMLAESNGGQPVNGIELARRMEISQASVTGMLKRLGELGLVDHVPYKGVALRDAGRNIALEVIRHHRLIESYLAEVMGMPWDQVHEEAEVLEHHISERLEALMAERLGHPQFDPHGHPIPGMDGKLPIRDGVQSLGAMEAGSSAVVQCVHDDRPEVLRYLDQLGLTPNRRVTLAERAPFDGPVTIVNEAGDKHALDLRIAEKVDVAI